MPRLLRTATLALALVVGLALPSLADREQAKAAVARGDYATALKEFRILADQGDAAAQYRLGVLDSDDWRIPQDHARQ